MKKAVLIVMFWMLMTSLFSQNTLPTELKGNWLNANDSIEWMISFQPGFAVYDTQFWVYEAIEPINDGYKIVLSNKTGKHQISADLIDDGSLMLTVDNQKPLRCTRKKALHPDFSNHHAPPFSGSLLTDDTATIRGFIEDYDPELYIGTGIVQYISTLTFFTDLYDSHFEISPDGRFEVKFRAFNPQMVYFVIEGSTQTRIFIVPGEVQMIAFNNALKEVTLDPRRWEGLTDFQMNHYMGTSGILSEEMLFLLRYYEHDLTTSRERTFNMESMSQLEYARWRKSVYTEDSSKMDDFMSKINTSERSRQVMKINMKADYIYNIYAYPIKMPSLTQLGPKYLAEMPQMDYEDPQYLLASEYFGIINYMTFFNNNQSLSPFRKIRALNFLDYADDHLIDIADTALINKQRIALYNIQNHDEDFHFKDESPQYDSAMLENSKTLWEPYNELVKKYEILNTDSARMQRRISEFEYAFQTYGRGLIGQMYAMHWMMLIKENKSLDSIYIQWAKQNITEPVLLNFLLKDHAKKKEAESRYSTYADGTIFIDSIPSIADSDTFYDEILTRFKGKVVYIDFWADWCSPCRAEIKPAAKLKKEYEGKDIVFLYFGMSCKKDAWQKVIMQEQMEGYHYWLDKNQGNVLGEKFGIIGIPHYLLVDKTGKILEGQPPRPSDKVEIREKLNEMLVH